ncbi:GNAT family N-acetyltransferase [Riemerella columbina]|uniref:GNAT family N-acetyltransferase n=1 Tax=Riemerella columbina TaxID=103810 RepID=UPI00266F69A2|nr:GNAT family N-acetyltransferase [Riemerella columbina]WKS95155.1 GNAT family N-acetyltransferase [Riemerella columbina]
MMDLRQDIYYQKDYVALYLKEGDSIFEFEYTEGDKTFYQLTIKRPIRQVGEVLLDEIYYDLETAYGYGGYLCNTDDMVFIEKAWTAYQNKCKEENIIAEFVRYHPFNESHFILKNQFSFYTKDRNVVLMDLSLSDEERWEGYASRTRGKLRKCDRELKIRKSEDIGAFMKLYNETMDKNNAQSFFYFDKDFYNKVLKIKEIELYNIYYEETILSSSFYIFSRDFVHYFLSGNNYNVQKNHNANYFIFEKIASIAKERGIKYFNLGGGRSGDPEDSLFKYKSLFSDYNRPFFLSGAIYNKEKYDELNQLWQTQNPEHEVKFFLKYRI